MTEKEFLTPLIPRKCLTCGAPRVKTGTAYPKRFEINVKVHYECGGNLIVHPKDKNNHCFVIETDECWCLGNVRTCVPTLELISHNKPLLEGTEVYYDYNFRKAYKVYPQIKGNKPFLRDQYFCLLNHSRRYFPYYEVPDKHCKIHYGGGILPLFSNWHKARLYAASVTKEHMALEGRDFTVENLYLFAIYRIAIKDYSHAVIDPDMNLQYYKNSDLSDLTTLRF